jgi:transposase
LKTRVAPGPVPVKSEAALRVVTPLLEAPVADRTNWTIPRLRAEIEAREGVRISRSQLSKALRKKLPLAAASAHAEGVPDRRCGGAGRPAPATAQTPGRSRIKPVVLVEDNGPIHTSKRSLAALSARAHWLTVEWLPKYATELNDIEPVWRDLKAHHLAHQTFTDAHALDRAIHHAVSNLNRERMTIPLAKSRISA